MLLSALLITISTLTVGPDKMYARIEDAYAAARAGDVVEIYPGSYYRTAVSVAKPNLRFVGIGENVTLDGTGFNYSGAGSVPRAIFQMNPGADGVTVENLTLTGAHNDSFNGSGVRINQASGVTIRKCRIFGNDMGIMSNGDGAHSNSASGQLIESCSICSNGNRSEPGQNHNLYLGGASVTVQFCDIYGSLTGHNLKSRAHFNLIQYNSIHDSANRELDLVDGWDTGHAYSNTVLMGNLIVKKPGTDGNRAVIHFGQDVGGTHNGTLYMFNNTVVTPYLSPVLQFSVSTAHGELVNNVIFNGDQAQPTLFSGVPGGSISGENNWISRGYSIDGTLISAATRYLGESLGSDPGFADVAGRNYFLLSRYSERYKTQMKLLYADGSGTRVACNPAYQYKTAAGAQAVKWATMPYIGAGLAR